MIEVLPHPHSSQEWGCFLKGFRGINPPRLKAASRFVLRSLDLIPDPLTRYPVLKLLFISRISRFRFPRPAGSLLLGRDSRRIRNIQGLAFGGYKFIELIRSQFCQLPLGTFIVVVVHVVIYDGFDLRILRSVFQFILKVV